MHAWIDIYVNTTVLDSTNTPLINIKCHGRGLREKGRGREKVKRQKQATSIYAQRLLMMQEK